MITLIAVGKMKAGAHQALAQFYTQRLRGDWRLIEIDVKSSADAARLQRLEEEKILAAIPAGAFVILLDSTGQQYSSEQLAALMQSRVDSGQALVFIIGGAYGVSEAVKARAQQVLAFGRATWPHQLARIMLLEQLYRVQQIKAGHPYHH